MAQSVSATRRISRLRRHTRLRKKLSGTAERPRLVVHRSARHIHVQLVNDLNGTTVAAASSIEADVRGVPGDKKGPQCAGRPVDRRAGQSRRHRHRGIRPRRVYLRRTNRRAGRRRTRERIEFLMNGRTA